ncbi:hypothetical protein AIGOOFII_3442 [Methylobacterium marchantiae]|nr:hypothetical protein AIGOOFII_3442 [Methylobacterium marchantiae]
MGQVFALSRSTLFLTDDFLRGIKIIKNMNAIDICNVVDVLDPDQSSRRPEMTKIRAIVSDVSFISSSTIGALRKHLDRFQDNRPPFFCLLHDSNARSRAQAQALGAFQTLPASRAAQLLPTALSMVGVAIAHQPDSISIDRKVALANAALIRLFHIAGAGGGVTLQALATAGELVETALSSSNIRGWLDVVWQFDNATHQHCLLVAGLVTAFGRQLGMSRADCQLLTHAALLHDVGKSRIPIAILNKPGKLDTIETAIMHEHPTLGHAMLMGQGFSEDILTVVRSHHEYLDGSGYPDGLTGTDIPDLVRLVTICDIFGALIERRSYKEPMSGVKAYAILESMTGKLDMDLVHAFRPLAELAS